MALRGSPARRLQDNPLGGLLRDLDRRARSTTRRRGRPAPQPVTEPQQPPEPPRPPVRVRQDAAAVLVSGDDGRAVWRFAVPYPSAPVLTALVVTPEPDGDQAVIAVAESVDAEGAVLRVWVTRPLRGTGVVEPAGAGMEVHVTARTLPG